MKDLGKNNFPFLGVEAPDWQGARSVNNSQPISTTSNAARRDGSAHKMRSYFCASPLWRFATLTPTLHIFCNAGVISEQSPARPSGANRSTGVVTSEPA